MVKVVATSIEPITAKLRVNDRRIDTSLQDIVLYKDFLLKTIPKLPQYLDILL